MDRIRCALMRGGTSKGAFFLADDLPSAPAERDDVLLRVMGSPDVRQIDGVGGAHPLTSKVAVVSRSELPGVDVDYLFCQVVVDEPVVSTSQTCGNMLAGVAPFAIERGLVPAQDGRTVVRVRMVNTGAVAALTVRTPGGVVTYRGDAAISGVPGTAAPVEVELDASDGALLPTGSPLDVLAGVPATCVDNGMPSVVVRAADLGLTGTEAPAALEADQDLVQRIREIRAAAYPLMGLDGDLEQTTTPKIVLVSEPRDGGTLATRSFIPRRVHQAIGVLGAASVAAASRLPGGVATALASLPGPGEPVRVEHPTGYLDLYVDPDPADPTVIRSTRVVRTARLLMDGYVFPR
ncbi:4-oxalomesaconate tautomerase [Actinotalea sp. M2MS4P-6]|uniref:4-oxalomesaconate tautomerase n=1 Tax=Actinotalea sp. M2MS4P-6 TaxID=2983762 RepID=UPI0021E407F7|nr:4-oxalomesaconate tautomerase [Actinotalea sp. M2MS4P-6]MCV2394327.1 4-oxalomesaconate tautomerase [Actinotalea sp. M2MS4P-6]